MPDFDQTSGRYLGPDYVAKNPTWDLEDSPWKAQRVQQILDGAKVSPRSIVDVGCGAGNVLLALRQAYPEASLEGYDIAPTAERFWEAPRAAGITLTVGDYTQTTLPPRDVLLVLDVLEHLQDPMAFLAQLRGRARHYVFHFPLDLSAISVLRQTPLLHVRKKVGHIHYYSKALALALLEDAGYRVIDARYTGAAFNAPQRPWKARLAEIPRRLVYAVHRDVGVRLLGGETLMVLATTDQA